MFIAPLASSANDELRALCTRFSKDIGNGNCGVIRSELRTRQTPKYRLLFVGMTYYTLLMNE